jgi:hypothetical protein
MGGLKKEAEKRRLANLKKGAADPESFPARDWKDSRDQYGKRVECEWAVC